MVNEPSKTACLFLWKHYTYFGYWYLNCTLDLYLLHHKNIVATNRHFISLSLKPYICEVLSSFTYQLYSLSHCKLYAAYLTKLEMQVPSFFAVAHRRRSCFVYSKLVPVSTSYAVRVVLNWCRKCFIRNEKLSSSRISNISTNYMKGQFT